MSLQEKLKRYLKSSQCHTSQQSEKNDNNKGPDSKKSKFFTVSNAKNDEQIFTQKILDLIKRTTKKLSELTFSGSVECVYDPTDYAYFTHSMFIEKYCTEPKHILFVGMNPGPWGMSQTGVPFGEVSIVRDWLEIYGPVNKPKIELPARPINGFDCTRSEVSGKRFWGFFKEICGHPNNFFKHAFIHNYCPLTFMHKSGKNITPNEIKGQEYKSLLATLDPFFVDTLKLLEVKTIIAIGRFVEKRMKDIIKEYKLENIEVFFIPHPSPRVVGSEKWPENIAQKLNEYNLMQYFQKTIE